MNTTYCSVWSQVRGTWIAVSEQARAHGKRSGRVIAGGVLLAATVTGAFAQSHGYVDGEDHAGALDATGGITLTSLDAGSAAQSGVISGNGGVIKAGAGALALNDMNSYAGGTTLSAGTLLANSNDALGSGPLTIGAGTTFGTRANTTLTNPVTVNGSFATDIVNTAGTPSLVLAGPVHLGADTTITQLRPSVLSFYGAIDGAHGLTFDSAASGLFVISGTAVNTYTGPTTVQGNAVVGIERTVAGASVPGDLRINDTGIVAVKRGNDQIASTATLTVNSPGQGNFQGFTFQEAGLTQTVAVLNGTGTIGLGGSRLAVGAGNFSGVLSDGSAGEAGPAISGGGIDKFGAGTLTLSGANSYTGTTTVGGGVLQAASANTLSAASAHSVAAGATLDLGGYSQTVAALTNSGTVSLLGATPGTDLRVTGAYFGSGGVLRLGTTLNAGAGPSDRLVLDGPGATARGQTTVQVTNIGGLGALTVGNGIEVIAALNGASTTAQTTKDAFALAGGHVDAGAYEYRLQAADATGAGESWYLRSTMSVPVTPPIVPPLVPPVVPVTPPVTEDPPTAPTGPVVNIPKLPDLATASVPTYRAEVAVYTAMPEVLRQGDLAMLGNLHRRVGDEGSPVLAESGKEDTRRGWGRLIGTTVTVSQDNATRPETRTRITGFQTGIDLYANPQWSAGLYVGALHGSSRTSGVYGVTLLPGYAGSYRTDSNYLGGYATYANARGLYADFVLQYGRHDLAGTSVNSVNLGTEGRSLSASAELGQRFALGGGWAIEPQAQLVYNRLNLEDAVIRGARVQQDSHDGTTARLGVRLVGDVGASVGRLQPYARLNVWHSFSGNDKTTFVGPAASTTFSTGIGSTSTELAGGFTLAMTPSASLYGEIGKLFAAGGSATRVKSSVQASVGLKFKL